MLFLARLDAERQRSISLMGGLDSPSNGQIFYDGKDIEKAGLSAHRKKMWRSFSKAII